MSTREQQRISRQLRSPTYPKRCVHHALFSDRCILCLKARIRDLSQQIDDPRRAAGILIGALEQMDLPETAQALRTIFLGRESGESHRVGSRGVTTSTGTDPAAAIPAEPHDCLTREHDPDEWCPDCFTIKKVDP